MKKLILSLTLLLLVATATISFADTYVGGYYRKDGTYVKPYWRSDKNDSKFDNWSSKGNINPYTGKKGYVDPYKSDDYFGDLFGGNNKNIWDD